MDRITDVAATRGIQDDVRPLDLEQAVQPARGAAGQERSQWVDDLLGRLDINQKVGQLMVFGSAGPVVTPHVRQLVSRYHVGGLRVAQKFFPGSSEARDTARFPEDYYRPAANTMDVPGDMRTKRIACTPGEYASVLNELRALSLDRKDSVPLHFAFDQEGEGADMLFRQRLLPYPMGLASSGDPELAHRAALAVGRQARALGLNMVHSPVLDVNTLPGNPEIGPRSYSDDPDVATRFALASLAGLTEAGITATGKHYPGRGASDSDAHHGLPVIDMDVDQFRRDHLAPFAALVSAGLPAIMAAFTAYPMLGSGDEPAATSYRIITELLREELGFQGVVTTDNIEMRGLLDRYEIGEATVRAIEAGCDLILCRSEAPVGIYIIETMIEAVRTGRLSEERLDASVRRILGMRWDMGLAEDGGLVDTTRADLFDDPVVKQTATEAAERTVTVLRDDAGVLPLRRDAKVLLIEQNHHFHSFINDMNTHPGMLWEELQRHGDNVSLCMVHETVNDSDVAAVRARLATGDYDLVVCTSYYNYRSHGMMLPLLPEILACGKPVVVVANTPYRAFGVPDEVQTAVVSYCPSGRENLSAVARVLYGDLRATAKLGVREL